LAKKLFQKLFVFFIFFSGFLYGDIKIVSGSVGDCSVNPCTTVGGEIGVGAIETALSLGDVNISSDSNITISHDINWSTNKLILNAGDNIHIEAIMTPSGTSKLAINVNTNTTNDVTLDEWNVSLDMFSSQISHEKSLELANNTGRLRVLLKDDYSGFKGKVDFGTRSGTGFLSIDGDDYEVVKDLARLKAIRSQANSTLKFALGTDIDNLGDVSVH
jgi:hypothetical protein